VQEGVALVYLPQLRGGEHSNDKTPQWVLKRLQGLLEGQVEDLQAYLFRHPAPKLEAKLRGLEKQLEEATLRLAARGYGATGDWCDGGWETASDDEDDADEEDESDEGVESHLPDFDTFAAKYTKMHHEYQGSEFCQFETVFDVLEAEHRRRIGTDLEGTALDNISRFLQDRATAAFCAQYATEIGFFATSRIDCTNCAPEVRQLLKVLRSCCHSAQ
jgi:hypothetical protein